ncbi:MAG: transglycosylase domain-containing protein [Leptolyngbyaceae bacterium]|nr:transglycosylase domain-containing protein [Leptolyngbyaceae bacterium]
MASPLPPNRPNSFVKTVTRLVQAVQARVDFSQLALRPNARVPKLFIDPLDGTPRKTYPLLGDRYLIGRSSQKCDIVVSNQKVSQVHGAVYRENPQPNAGFVIEDQKSTNGIYIGKRRITTLPLRHGDVLTFGPPDLADAVRLEYQNPPPPYLQILRYALYGFTGITALIVLWILTEWQKVSVYPLPESVQGPVIVYAQDGVTPLRQSSKEAHVEFSRLSEFPSFLPKAVMASEDSRYYWHLGVDPIGILRALITNVRGGGIREGGSTITQQLARSIFRDYVGTEDSAQRKIREAIVALKLETYYSKDFLMLTYLNRVYLGQDNSGFEDAAQFYFDKSAKDLDLSEAATLVGILPAPNSFNPVEDYDKAMSLRNRVLDRMLELGMADKVTVDDARRSPIIVSPEAIEELRSTLAPYFYAQTLLELQDLLGSEVAREGNFIIESTVNLELQAKAEASLVNSVNTAGAASGFSQGAIVTIDAATGNVLAIVGGTDYRTSQFNRATQALRQPGSTFKIFPYAVALEKGISPSKTYACTPLTWQGQVFNGCRAGSGPVDMYRGMALSENVVALRIAQEVGLVQVVRMAQRMGIDSDLQAVPGLVLGQSEVTVLEMTAAFGILANQGIYHQPRTIKRVLDSRRCEDLSRRETCRVIYPPPNRPDAAIGQQVLSTNVATQMTTLLQTVIQSGTGRNARLGYSEAGKTGTTNRNVDLWFVGYLPQQRVVTGIWLGNDDNSPSRGSSTQAAQLWGDYMRRSGMNF